MQAQYIKEIFHLCYLRLQRLPFLLKRKRNSSVIETFQLWIYYVNRDETWIVHIWCSELWRYGDTKMQMCYLRFRSISRKKFGRTSCSCFIKVSYWWIKCYYHEVTFSPIFISSNSFLQYFLKIQFRLMYLKWDTKTYLRLVCFHKHVQHDFKNIEFIFIKRHEYLIPNSLSPRVGKMEWNWNWLDFVYNIFCFIFYLSSVEMYGRRKKRGRRKGCDNRWTSNAITS